MRAPPEDVPPLVHEGVRYEAPHWGALRQAAQDSQGPLGGPDTVETRMERALGQALERAMATARNAIMAGRMPTDEETAASQVNPSDPGWIRAALTEAGFGPEDVGVMVEQRRVQALIQGALNELMMSRLMTAMTDPEAAASLDPGAGPYGFLQGLDPEVLCSRLQGQGVAREQVERYLASLNDQAEAAEEMMARPRPQNGGFVVASDANTGERLWELEVYRTEYDNGWETDVQDVFITALEVEDGHLLVRDERRRVHRVDLATRAVVGSSTDTTPTPLDQARQIMRALPAGQRKQMWEELWAMKCCLDQHSMSTWGLTESPQDTLPVALDRFLASLGTIADRHPCLQQAFWAGREQREELGRGADPHILYDWIQGELMFVFEELFHGGCEEFDAGCEELFDAD